MLLSVNLSCNSPESIKGNKKYGISVSLNTLDENVVSRIKCGSALIYDTFAGNSKIVQRNEDEVVLVSGHSNTFRMTVVYYCENDSLKKNFFVMDRLSLSNIEDISIEIFPYVHRNKLIILKDEGDIMFVENFSYSSDNVHFELIGDQLYTYKKDSLVMTLYIKH